MPSILSPNRLQSGLVISKLFHFLYFIPTLTTPCRFSQFSLHQELQLTLGRLLPHGLDSIHVFQHCIYMNRCIFTMVCKEERCALKQTCSECQELCRSYYTLKGCNITSPVMDLPSCKKPKGGPLSHSQDALLGVPDQTRGVVRVTKSDQDIS